MQEEIFLRDRELKIFFAISFLVLSILILYLFSPLLNTILLGFVFAFLFFPVYKKMLQVLKKPRLTAFVVCFLFILIITIPVFLAINTLAIEVVSLTNRFSGVSIIDSMQQISCDSDSGFCSFVNDFIGNSFVETTVEDLLNEVSVKSKVYIGELLLMLPGIILQVFIVIFMMYYLFIDGEVFIDRIKCFLPIGEKHKERLFTEINKTTGGILFGSVLVGAVQGLLGALGFFIFGVKAPLLWGVIMFLFSFVPFVGTGIVWFPTSVYIIINSVINHDSTGLYRGVGLLIYCSLIVSTIDNFLRPKLVSSKTNLHPVLVLFGVLGGIFVFKTAGIIIGPLILGIFITILNMYDAERRGKCGVHRVHIPAVQKKETKKHAIKKKKKRKRR